MKILISSLCPFIISGYSNQINLFITYLHKFDPSIEIAIICWNDWNIPFSYNYYDLISLTSKLNFKISSEQYEIYKNVKFYSPGKVNNHWQKIKLYDSLFKPNKIFIYQDIWIFDKFDINSIKTDKYLWIPIHNDFREHNLLSFKENFNTEINNLYHLPFFKKISTFSKFGVEVLKMYGYNSTFINHMIPNHIFNKTFDKKQLRIKYNFKENDFICLMVARNAESSDRKAYYQQFEAFSLFSKNKDNCFLLIHENHKRNLHEGALNLHNIAKSFNILDKIKLTDKTLYQQDHIVELFNLANVLLCASKSEGFGLPMVEAQFCNLLVITNNCTSMPDNTFYGICTEPETISNKVNNLNSWSNPSPVNISNALEKIYNNDLSEYDIKPIDKSLYDPEILINKWIDFLELNNINNKEILCYILNEDTLKIQEILDNIIYYKIVIFINPKYDINNKTTNYINFDYNKYNNIIICNIDSIEFNDYEFFYNYLNSNIYFYNKINQTIIYLINNKFINNNDVINFYNISQKFNVIDYLNNGINNNDKNIGEFIFNNHIANIKKLLYINPTRYIKNINDCLYSAVLIETRNSPLIEPILLNTINLTNDDIGFHIFYHKNNQNLINSIIRKYNLKNIHMTLINHDIKNNIEYSKFLFSKDFFENIITEKILIFQLDSLLLQQLDNKYFNYDWIGAIWNNSTLNNNPNLKKLFENLLPIGNGGFNIRNINKCKKIAQDLNFQYPIINNLLLNEDNVFSILLQNNNAYLPSVNEANEFSTETIPSKNPIAMHAFYKYFVSNSNNIDYIYNIFDRHYHYLKNYFNNLKYKNYYYIYDQNLIEDKLNNLHNNLKLKYGSFKDEYPEQKMITRFISGNEKILEIGSNIGRSSLIIASILNSHNNNNFVTLESDNEIFKQLNENKNINNLDFFTENYALSKRKLFQNGWNTFIENSNINKDNNNFKEINTITFEQLKNKYNFDFDTLILDCEGAFYYILTDMPEILKNINLIIVENDYTEKGHKEFIDKTLIDNNFNCIYVESILLNVLHKNNFYEVWKKSTDISNNTNIHPINFSIPNEKIITYIPTKKKLLSSNIPNFSKKYIIDNEIDYYKEYQDSLFAITYKKAGWDCLRHYEILANGCIPVFENINDCPDTILTKLPKQLLIQSNNLYYKLKNKTFSELNNDDINECNQLIKKLLNYTKNNLSTTHIAKYILESINIKNVKNILFLSNTIEPDYIRCLTLHGFKTIFNSNCYDFPKIPHLYKSYDNSNNLYGNGFTYSKLIDDDNHIDISDTIIDKIKNKFFDIIIYGSYHRGIPLFDFINQYYLPNEIILLCGEDQHNCCLKNIKDNYNIFIREL